MRRSACGWTGVGAVLAVVLVAGRVEAADDPTARVDRSREVFQELIHSPDRAIPETLLASCRCIAVFPHVLKGAIGFGARYGKGVASCRDASGHWSPPAFFTLGGGSWGLQIGAEASDLVLFFMTERGTKSLLESKFTLGAKAGVAAGPAGRAAEAETDLKLEAEIYSYARTKGLFAGLSLEGARLAPDGVSARIFYGEPVSAESILFRQRVPKRPEAAQRFTSALP